MAAVRRLHSAPPSLVGLSRADLLALARRARREEASYIQAIATLGQSERSARELAEAAERELAAQDAAGGR